MQYKIGVVGLGVMGHNLALNMERNGFCVAGYDLDAAKGRAFLDGPAAGRNVALAESPDRLMAMLKKPRRVLMMVPAGPAVDSAIAHLKTHLEPGESVKHVEPVRFSADPPAVTTKLWTVALSQPSRRGWKMSTTACRPRRTCRRRSPPTRIISQEAQPVFFC